MSNQSNDRLIERAMEEAKCSHPDCEREHHAKQLCLKHYKRLRKGKDPYSPSKRDVRRAIIEGDIAKIPLGVGGHQGYTVVDKEFAWLAEFKWAKVHGYALRDPKAYKPCRMHHLILGVADDLVTDHKNRDRLDNRKANLRLVTRGENNQNKTRTSDKVGVYHNKPKNRYIAMIHLGYADPAKTRKRRVTQSFKTLNEAINARKLMEEKYYVERG